ncbi:hypothetical protein ADIWIN_3669 [Winogradskyella psychrotolerans RS-3]|uniref:Uncharacterized protein n=1 Tax=Winogradskyella psychrotolerans RS-3 TaxID=641526 RepID=S7X2G7_9FLAO|nr:hypothetical protein [Winogradskyella psychrotolerans]EPR70313.1 hypothetical protein ADIWIN_3669 [Winogradskyella psychrotolerans RS-3]
MSDDYKSDSGNYFDNDKGEDKGHFSSAHEDAYDAEKISALLRVTNSIVELGIHQSILFQLNLSNE